MVYILIDLKNSPSSSSYEYSTPIKAVFIKRAQPRIESILAQIPPPLFLSLPSLLLWTRARSNILLGDSKCHSVPHETGVEERFCLAGSVCIKLIGRPCGKVSRMGGTDPDYTTLFLLKSLSPPAPARPPTGPKYSRPSRIPHLSDSPKADFLAKTQFGRDLYVVIFGHFKLNSAQLAASSSRLNTSRFFCPPISK